MICHFRLNLVPFYGRILFFIKGLKMQFIKLGDCNLALASISGFECKGCKDASIDLSVYSDENLIAYTYLSFQTPKFWEIFVRTSFPKTKTEKGAMILNQICKITNDLAYKIEQDFISVLNNLKEQNTEEPYIYDYNQRLKEFESYEEAEKIKELVKEFVKTYNELSFFKKLVLRLWF